MPPPTLLRTTLSLTNPSLPARHLALTKHQIYTAHNLPYRDLRKLDPLQQPLPAISAEKNGILLNTHIIRAIITSHELYLFPPTETELVHQQITEQFEKHSKKSMAKCQNEPITTALLPGDYDTKTKELPKEFIALETLLGMTVRNLRIELIDELVPTIEKHLDELERSTDRDALIILLRLTKSLNKMTTTLTSLREGLQALLNNDSDMAAMYLSHMETTGKPREIKDHEELELLLEGAHQQANELLTLCNSYTSTIKSTEQILHITLASLRTDLASFDAKINSWLLFIGGGSFCTGVFGMNLRSGLETTDGFFWALVSVLVAVMTIGIKINSRYLAQARRKGLAYLHDPSIHGRDLWRQTYREQSLAKYRSRRPGRNDWLIK